MLKLRQANKEDEHRIMDLVKSVLSDYGLKTNSHQTDKDLSDLEHFYFNKNGWFAVIENENEIIGSYGIFKIDGNTCELRKMYLLKNYQGQGLGKLMMEDAFNKARELGYSEIILETNRLLDKAIALYEKYGFVRYEPSHLSDRCDFAMRRKI